MTDCLKKNARNWLFFCYQVSEAGVHRPHVGGIHGRSNDGAYSLVLAGGFEDEVVCHLCKQQFCYSNVSMFVKIELCLLLILKLMFMQM